MSALINNIKRLAGMVRNETASGGNNAHRVGGLFEEIAAELEMKYDKKEMDNFVKDLSYKKLDKTGDGKEVTVTFAGAGARENAASGDTLAVLFGKVQKWFTDLKSVAFSGEAKDLSTDASHRLVSDEEKAGWNGKAAGSHRHPAGQIDEEEDRRFMTDAERVKVADTYTKEETYTRGEVNTGDAGVLALAKEYASQKIAEVIGSSPEALNTLYELATALNNDPNFATSIMALIAGKADGWHQHTRAQITDFPTSLPASDVYDWAKQPGKPGYTPGEVGAATSDHNHDDTYQPAGNYAPDVHRHNWNEIDAVPDFTDSIKPGTLPHYDQYIKSGKYHIPSTVPGGPRFYFTNDYVLLEVEVMPNGAIYQTVKSCCNTSWDSGTTTTGEEYYQIEVFARAFCAYSGEVIPPYTAEDGSSVTGTGEWLLWRRMNYWPPEETSTTPTTPDESTTGPEDPSTGSTTPPDSTDPSTTEP
ncbi:MAG: hypothetical protein LBR65_03965 [Culturomica sp.]|jgi:hypothetical protein|nr:hypothetical protein [Culturomica sp.]